jgi:outer membrane protein assembly factor BamE (lipoprotein component of BamABCDE complex)
MLDARMAPPPASTEDRAPEATWPRRGQPGHGRTTARVAAVLAAGLLLAFALPGCASRERVQGVANHWRDAALPAFERGATTQAQVIQRLGPPSQLINLHDQTVLYYVREHATTTGLYLVVYNQSHETITYDRAIFFFDRTGILTDFAYSQEALPPGD